MRWSRIATIVAALLVAQAPELYSVRAEDGGAGAPASNEEFEKQRRKALDAAAAKLEAVAAFAHANKLKMTALDSHRLIIELNPEFKRSREALGWVRKGSEWVADEMKQDRLNDVEDESEKARSEYEKRWKEARTAAATILVDIGSVASRSGDDAAARTLWNQARNLDPQHAEANRLLGHAQNGGRWVSPHQARRDAFQRAVVAARDKVKDPQILPVVTDDTSGTLEGQGQKSVRYRAGDLRVETNLDLNPGRRDLEDAVRVVETERRLFRELLKGAAPSACVVVISKIRSSSVPPDLTKSGRRSALPRGEASRRPDGTLLVTAEGWHDAIPLILHALAHDAVDRAFPESADWIREGLVNSLSTLALPRTIHNCQQKLVGAGDPNRGHIEVDFAGILCGDLARAGRWRPMSELALSRAADWREADTCKSWSAVLFLISTDRALALAYFRDASGDPARGADPAVLAKSFPAFPSWKEFDRSHDEWAVEVAKPTK